MGEEHNVWEDYEKIADKMCEEMDCVQAVAAAIDSLDELSQWLIRKANSDYTEKKFDMLQYVKYKTLATVHLMAVDKKITKEHCDLCEMVEHSVLDDLETEWKID